MENWQIDDAAYQRWIENIERPRLDKLSPPNYSIVNDEEWPLLSIVMPTYNTPAHFLGKALASVLDQSYPKWELCIADDASTDVTVKQTIQHFIEKDSRFKAVFRPLNEGIAAATNTALSLASGQYVVFMDHDDELPKHSLLLVVQDLHAHPDTQLLYSDSDNLNEDGKRCNPFFKPDWNYDLFLGQNYLNHLSVYRRDLLENIGGLRAGLQGSQDYDLALRAIECISHEQIRHIPHILYHWRIVPSSISQANLGMAVKAARKAVTEHLQRSDQAATVATPENAIIYNRVDWRVPSTEPGILILVHGKDEQVIHSSIAAIEALTEYPDFTVKKLTTIDKKPLGAQLNTAIANTKENLVCVIAAGFYPQNPTWLYRFAGHLNRAGIGIVGPKILSEVGKLVSGPPVTAMENLTEYGPLLSTFKDADEVTKGYFGRLNLDHEVNALHGACLAVRTEHLTGSCPFNANMSDLALLGTDLCFTLHKEGFSAIWSAATVLRCSEAIAQSIFSTAPTTRELECFLQVWAQNMRADPHYNPNFSRSGARYQLPD